MCRPWSESKINKDQPYLVMNQHLLVIFVYVHQRYNTYWYVETDFFFMYTIDRGKNSCYFFVFFFFFIVFPPPLRSAFTSKLQQLYKEGRPRKVRSGKEIIVGSETVYLRYQFLKKKTHFIGKGQAWWYTGSLFETPCQSVAFLIRTVKLREFWCLCVHYVSETNKQKTTKKNKKRRQLE